MGSGSAASHHTYLMSVQRKTTGGLPQPDFKSSSSDPGAGEAVPPRLPGAYLGDMYLSKRALNPKCFVMLKTINKVPSEAFRIKDWLV
ncbi:uncharacterized protein GJ701_017892 isoform 1-T1 [Geothlypis trichas]